MCARAFVCLVFECICSQRREKKKIVLNFVLPFTILCPYSDFNCDKKWRICVIVGLWCRRWFWCGDFTNDNFFFFFSSPSSGPHSHMLYTIRDHVATVFLPKQRTTQHIFAYNNHLCSQWCVSSIMWNGKSINFKSNTHKISYFPIFLFAPHLDHTHKKNQLKSNPNKRILHKNSVWSVYIAYKL